MSASAPYTIFSGAAEMVAGLLLFFPRTAALGALISIGVTSQVVALNFCYDVPAKLFSSHLLALAIFLVAHDARRLANLFVRNRTAAPAVFETVLQRPAYQRAAFVLKMLVLVGVTVSAFYHSYSTRQRLLAEPPLFGIWEVEEFKLGGEVRPPLLTDYVRWRRLIIGHSGTFAFVQRMNDERRGYRLKVDADTRKLTLQDDEFSYSTHAPETLRLAGNYRGRSFSVTLRRVDENEFLLMNRGFHWINEFPFNR